MMKKALTWILVFLILLSTVTALGIAPSRKVIDYEPGEIQLGGRILNNEKQAMKVMLIAEGPLKEHVTFEQNILNIKQDQGEFPFTYTVDIPESLEPGTQEINILAVQLPPDETVLVVNLPGDDTPESIITTSYETEKNVDDQKEVSARIAVTQQLRIMVPFPGQWVDGRLFIQTANIGDDIEFVVSIFNRGTEPVNVSGRIIIKGPTNQLIDEIELTTQHLAENGEGKLVGQWKNVEYAGEYLAEAQILFADKHFTLQKQFSVGNLFIQIKDIVVANFRLGSIAKFDVLVRNQWNKAVQEIFANFTVLDKAGKVLSTFKSSEISLQALQEGNVTGYWDTAGVDQGAYDINVILNYASRTSEKLFSAVVGLDSIEFINSPIGRVIDDSERFQQTYQLLIALVGLLILLNIVGITIFIRKKRS
ncbi:hypothetical protein CMO92_01630 [Candidatus Woesearchaeota archaeon]|nr:hypothetical protein [Candidatus Woesearchaeota archaeon]